MTPTPEAAGDRPVRGADLGQALDDLRERSPLVHCLTNAVVMNWTANVLLAAGAAPAMVDNPHEAASFAGVASGVLVNLGTPNDDTVAAMHEAVRGAAQAGTPWVLDPVAAGGLAWRTEVAHDLLTISAPAIVRGNPSEILGLTGGSGGRGVDSTAEAESAVDAARALALEHGCVVAISGAVDIVTDGTDVVRIPGGHAWLTRVIGTGCALGALMAAFAAVTGPLAAACAATRLLTAAAEDAAAASRAPGTFGVALLDELSQMTGERLAQRAGLA